jgi:hypothetical protein
MLKGDTGQAIEFVPGFANSTRPHIDSIDIGGLRGGDSIGVSVGHGTIDQYELVQEDAWGEVKRHDGSSDHGCVGVNLRPSTDGKAWHYARRMKTNLARIKIWHPPSSDPAFPDSSYPIGTLLKPSTDHPGFATKAHDAGDGQIIGALRTVAPVGESLQTCQIDIK